MKKSQIHHPHVKIFTMSSIIERKTMGKTVSIISHHPPVLLSLHLRLLFLDLPHCHSRVVILVGERFGAGSAAMNSIRLHEPISSILVSQQRQNPEHQNHLYLRPEHHEEQEEQDQKRQGNAVSENQVSDGYSGYSEQ